MDDFQNFFPILPRMSLYQSYRPKNFSDVVGQEFVKKVLANSCKTQTFHHGYIFFGFHGIGKTTLARIFAEAVNCTNITPDGNPCHNCPNCLAFDNHQMIDVVEIDAASYTGVDNIREIIDHAKFTPTQGKYKIYIIDEVHMLSKGAFNALLKTLEEPPAHAIFLLATTEIAKVPDTILSRVIRFDLTKISEADMRWLLEKICTQESITWEKEAIDMIIRRARGSLRDALTMLEKCIFDKKVETKNVEAALHLVSLSFLKETFDACMSWDAKEIQKIVNTLEQEATDVRQFAAQMTEWIVEHIGEAFEQKLFPLYQELFDLFTRIYVQSRQVAVPMDIMRMSLYERIKSGKLEKSSPPEQHEMSQHTLIAPESKEIETPKHELPAPEHELAPTNHVLPDSHAELPSWDHEISMPQENWIDSTFSSENFLKKLEELWIKSTILPLLRTAKITKIQNEITVATTAFGKSRCEDPVFKPLFFAAAEFFGCPNIVFITDEKQIPEEVQTNSADMARAIFE